MYRFVKRMIALGFLMIIAAVSIVCTACVDKEEEAKVLVIKFSKVDIENSSSDLKIDQYGTFDEFKAAIEEIDAANMQFAPEGYSDTTYDKNCVLMQTKPARAHFSLDAEHMITIATFSNYFYIQYDSVNSAMSEMELLNEMNEHVSYAVQDKQILYNEEWLC